MSTCSINTADFPNSVHMVYDTVHSYKNLCIFYMLFENRLENELDLPEHLILLYICYSLRSNAGWWGHLFYFEGCAVYSSPFTNIFE